MRGSFALAVLAMTASMIGAVGCGDASVDIAAEQHGKRLNLVSGESTELAATSIQSEAKTAELKTQANAFRDFAGAVIVAPTGSVLHEWLLSEDGATLITRTCPVNATGVSFLDCSQWSAPAPVSSVGLTGPVRSFSTYVFPQADGSPALEEAVFDMSGGARSERTCAIANGTIDESACGDWTSSVDAIAMGIPQERAFDDEVVISYVDAKGQAQLSQELVSLTGSKAWQRTCAADSTSTCSFSSAVSLAELGIHYESIEGIGGYTFTERDEVFYAQTVIAPGGHSGDRRICPVSPSEGVQVDKCGRWETLDLEALPTANRAVF